MYACFSKYISSSDDVDLYSSVPGRISIEIIGSYFLRSLSV